MADPHSGLLPPQGHLHDRYGQLVNVYTKLLLTKISFHLKVVSSELWGWREGPWAFISEMSWEAGRWDPCVPILT